MSYTPNHEDVVEAAKLLADRNEARPVVAAMWNSRGLLNQWKRMYLEGASDVEYRKFLLEVEAHLKNPSHNG